MLGFMEWGELNTYNYYFDASMYTFRFYRLPKFRRKIMKLLSCIWPASVDRFESSTQMRRNRAIKSKRGVMRNHGGDQFHIKSACTESTKSNVTTKQRRIKFRQNLESFEESNFVFEFKAVTIMGRADGKPMKQAMIVHFGDQRFDLIHHYENGRRLSM